MTDYIDASGISTISQLIDAEDYTFGIFAFGDVELVGHNKNGILNDANDPRSIFQFTRDLAKVRAEFQVENVTRDSSGKVTAYSRTDTITFKGLIQEEATRLDLQNNTVTFRVLTLDSVLRTTQIPGGLVEDSDLASEAIQAILNQTSITAVLNVIPANITVDQDFTIDTGSAFDNISVFDGLKKLLVPANSVLIINSSDDVIVRSRDEDTTPAILELYGEFDLQGRNNMLDLFDHNYGFHRMFNSMFFSDVTEVKDAGFISEFGLRQKQVTVDFVTNTTTLDTIGNNLLDAFKAPKQELKVTIPMTFGKDVSMLQRVTIDSPLRNEKPSSSTWLPIFGDAEYGDSETPYPNLTGSYEIHPNLLWKVIEINHDVINYLTTLKLRQTGNTIGDGYTA